MSSPAPKRPRHHDRLRRTIVTLPSAQNFRAKENQAKNAHIFPEVVPPEIVAPIFSYLSACDVWPCLGVSKSFWSWGFVYLSISITASNLGSWIKSRSRQILQFMLESDPSIFQHTRHLTISLCHLLCPTTCLPKDLILGILASATELKTVSFQLPGQQRILKDAKSLKGLREVLNSLSRKPNIRISISIERVYNSNLDILPLVKVVRTTVSSIQIDTNYFEAPEVQAVQAFCYSLRDYNSLEIFNMLGGKGIRKQMDWQAILPESIRTLTLPDPSVIQALPANLHELDLSGGSRVDGQRLAMIFQLRSLRKLSLHLDVSDKDIPSEFCSQQLSTFKVRFHPRPTIPIIGLMEVIIRRCPNIQKLELNFRAQIEPRLLKLCFGCPALTTLFFDSGTPIYKVDDICSSLEIVTGGSGHQKLKSMRIPYPRSESHLLSFSQIHRILSLLPNLQQIAFAADWFFSTVFESSRTLYSTKLHYLTPDPCLKLCTILMSTPSNFSPELLILVPQMRETVSEKLNRSASNKSTTKGTDEVAVDFWNRQAQFYRKWARHIDRKEVIRNVEGVSAAMYKRRSGSLVLYKATQDGAIEEPIDVD